MDSFSRGNESPVIRQFSETLANISTADAILGGSPSRETIKTIDPTTWLTDFDRNTARPGTSRRVSHPTPNQRDDYVERSPKPISSNTNSLTSRHATYTAESAVSEIESDSELSREDLSLDTVQAIVAVIANVHNSSDEIFKTYSRHQVIVALLLAINKAESISPTQRLAVKMSVVMGRLAAAISNYRELTRAKV